MTSFTLGTATLNYTDVGTGLPLVFEHGIGGDVRQPFDRFGDDLIGLLNHLGIARAVLGGISLGAGVALNAATRYPERVAGLVLGRPAWLADAIRGARLVAVTARSVNRRQHAAEMQHSVEIFLRQITEERTWSLRRAAA